MDELNKVKLGESGHGVQVTVAKSTNLRASSFYLGDLEHPNQMPFSGILTWFDAPSDNAPNGSGGRKVVIPSAVGIPALGSLKGMAVNYVSGSMNGHDTTNKIGVITETSVGEPQQDGAMPVYIEGYIYAYDFEDAAVDIKLNQNTLGFSYETAKTLISDGIWNGEAVAMVQDLGWFTGASILYKATAAYVSTSIAASADAPQPKEVDEKVMEEKLELMLQTMLEGIADLKSYVDERLDQFQEVLVKQDIDEKVEELDEAGEEAEEGAELEAGKDDEAGKADEADKADEAKKADANDAEKMEDEEGEGAIQASAEESVEEVVEAVEADLNASAELDSMKAELEAAKKELSDLKASVDLQASARKSIAYPMSLVSKYGVDEEVEHTQLMASIEQRKDLSIEERIALKLELRAKQAKK